jgi:UDP-N-acetylmuramoyl-tripeptide--D-alanyl-D-alanine ligase
MSSFLTPEAMRDATGGRWLRAPTDACAPAGLSIDTRDPLAGKVYLALRGERFDGHDFLKAAVDGGAVLLVVERALEPGALAALGSVAVLLVADTRKALGDLASRWRSMLTRTRVVAITGSSGKTTTRRLVEAVLATSMQGSASPKSFNNDIGVPLTILSAKPEHAFLVLEIGMNHPGEIRALASIARPDIAVITMVGRAHLEGLGSERAIAVEKASILEPLAEGGVAIVHGDGDLLAEVLRSSSPGCATRASILRFGSDRSRDLDLVLAEREPTAEGQRIVALGRSFDRAGARFEAELALPGAHNASNALAAILVGRAFGLSDDAIRTGLAAVRPAAMRMERVERDGVVFYNDAYNANPDAMAASIRTFAEIAGRSGRRFVILGDMLELGERAEVLHEEVGRVAGLVHRSHPIDGAILVGRHAHATRRGLATTGWSGECVVAPTLDDELVERIHATLRPGDEVLLKGSRGSAMERVLRATGVG